MEAQTIIELLGKRAEQHPERIALRFLSDGENVDSEFNYGDLYTRVRALAQQLAERANVGDRALLLYPTGPDYVLSLLACFAAGIIAVPAYPPQSTQAQHLSRILSITHSAKPRLVLAQQELLSQVDTLKGLLGPESGVHLLATDALELASNSNFQPVSVAENDVAMLQFTSGSTSAPKGVMLTHGNLMANECAIQTAFGIETGDVIVSWLPLFHDMGLIGTLLQPLYSGVSAVLLPYQRFMERPRRWLEAISRFRGTVSGAPDFAYRLALQRSEASEGPPLDLSCWKLAFCGAEPVRAATLQAFADRFASVGFNAKALYPCYGLAEATLLVASGEPGTGIQTAGFDAAELAQNRARLDARAPLLVACGHAWPQHELLIADAASGASLSEGHVGEILVSGPSIARGYWDNPTASEASFVHLGARRYLRTGDLGFVSSGALFITGRVKDLIIVRGQNLYPQDIEQLVEEQSEALRKGRVVAFSLERRGEEGIAVVAEVNARLQKFVDASAVCNAISEAVARAFGEVPALVALLAPGSVPITSSGKLQRSACKRACLKREVQFVGACGAWLDDAASSEATR